MTNKKNIKFIILRIIGNFLVIFSIFGIIATLGPTLFYEISFRLEKLQGIKYEIIEIDTPSEFGKINKKITTSKLPKNDQGIRILIPVDTNFSIVIPKIGINTKIFPNVDSSSEADFLPILQKGIAHARGSIFPGMKGNIYLFAHSTDNFWNVGRYNSQFYLLKDMTAGDEVSIFFENIRHNYIVVDSRVIEALDTSYLINSQNKKEESLIMQTCWPPGTTWKRLIVIAKPK